MITVWEILTADGLHYLGPDSLLPEIITSADPRPVVEQVNERYAHGGGWRPFTGFKWDREKMTIKYPGDPAYHACGKAEINPKETVYVFPHAWVLIDRGGTDWEICRMD